MASSGRVVAAVIGFVPPDAVLRAAFAEADRRGAPVEVLAVGPAGPADLDDEVQRWADKYPDVPVTISARRTLDAAITLTAASRDAGLLVADVAGDPIAAAVLRAVRRRAHCPVLVAAPH